MLFFILKNEKKNAFLSMKKTQLIGNCATKILFNKKIKKLQFRIK